MESERNTLYWTQPNQAYRLVSSYYDWQVACVGIKLPIVLKHKKNIAESTIIASVTAMATPIMCDDLS